jgi:CheY-like chemotaxis protein
VDASCLAEAQEAVSTERFDAVLLDLNLPDGNGLEWIDQLRAGQPDIAIVVITGSGDIPTAVEAMRRGADNFLTKPVDMPELGVCRRTISNSPSSPCHCPGWRSYKDDIRHFLGHPGCNSRMWGIYPSSFSLLHRLLGDLPVVKLQ